MKFNKFIYATMAAALLAACSDKDVITDGPGNSGNTGEIIGDGYVAVNINLPVQLVTAAPRAANDNFDDGTANEYAVTDGALLLFTGTTESDAKFAGAYDLSLNDWVNDDDNDNITTSHLTAVKVNVGTLDSGEKLYGLVMLNYTNVMAKLAAGKNATITINDTESFGDSNTFADLVGKMSSNAFYTGKLASATKFLMCNAPLSNNVSQNGGSAPSISDVTTLVEFASDAIKATEAEAKAYPAASVFVERAVAKATLSSTAVNLDMASSTEDKTAISGLQIDGKVTWALNVTNPKSYIVRNMGTVDFMGYKNSDGGNYRMVGNTKIGTTSIQPVTNFYRTYWCIDPNYDGQTTNPLDYVNSYAAADFVDTGNTNPLYCHENTFNVASQNHKSTTQAIVRVAFKLDDNGGTFFTVNGRQDTIYATAAKAEVFSKDYILNDMGIKNAIKKALDGTGVTLELTGSTYSKYLTITFTRNATTGYREVTEIKFVDEEFTKINGEGKYEDVYAKAPEWSDEQESSLMARVNAAYRIAEYTGGVNYYPVRFKHFAGADFNDINDLAPWNPTKLGILNTTNTDEAYNVSDYSGATGTADNMWLGRYGMVRNNWYDVEVTAFKHLGEPEIGSLKVDSDTKPDDIKETEQWIAFKVNVLSWAKRKQSIEL